MADLYRPLYLNQAPILYTSRRTAELIKYAANAFLATKITFINEIADLCEKVGGDVQLVARGIGLDNRIGGKFLHAGPGDMQAPVDLSPHSESGALRPRA
jgi:UDPglucose 6-dehydrogenase